MLSMFLTAILNDIYANYFCMILLPYKSNYLLNPLYVICWICWHF